MILSSVTIDLVDRKLIDSYLERNNLSANAITAIKSNTVITGDELIIGTKLVNLKTAVLPNVEVAGDYLFYRCNALSNIELGNNCKHIGQYAFKNTNLKVINLPKSVGAIGKGAFATWYTPDISIDNINIRQILNTNQINMIFDGEGVKCDQSKKSWFVAKIDYIFKTIIETFQFDSDRLELISLYNYISNNENIKSLLDKWVITDLYSLSKICNTDNTHNALCVVGEELLQILSDEICKNQNNELDEYYMHLVL